VKVQARAYPARNSCIVPFCTPTTSRADLYLGSMVLTATVQLSDAP
jgi:hypothetical protein